MPRGCRTHSRQLVHMATPPALAQQNSTSTPQTTSEAQRRAAGRPGPHGPTRTKKTKRTVASPARSARVPACRGTTAAVGSSLEDWVMLYNVFFSLYRLTRALPCSSVPCPANRPLGDAVAPSPPPTQTWKSAGPARPGSDQTTGDSVVKCPGLGPGPALGRAARALGRDDRATSQCGGRRAACTSLVPPGNRRTSAGAREREDEHGRGSIFGHRGATAQRCRGATSLGIGARLQGATVQQHPLGRGWLAESAYIPGCATVGSADELEIKDAAGWRRSARCVSSGRRVGNNGRRSVMGCDEGLASEWLPVRIPPCAVSIALRRCP
jgi:hypothetical protein